MVFAIVAAFLEKGYKKRQFIAVGMFSFVIAGCVTAQLYFPDYPIYSFGLGVGTIIIYSFIVVSQRQAARKEILEVKGREEQQLQEIKDTRELAYTDPLTGVKNKHAYVEFESKTDELIREDKIDVFGLAVFDLNDLKLINDTFGHEAGDEYIIESCRLIQSIFPNTTMYRFGGDEFIIMLEGETYENRFKLLDEFNAIIDENNVKDDRAPIIAAGISNYVRGSDNTLRTVFLRADERMYARKKRLKEINSRQANEEDVGNKSTGANLMKIRQEMYEMFYRSSGVSLIDMLNGSSCDEILEIDIPHDTYKQLYHVDGKYFVPAVGTLSFKDLLDFVSKYIIHPDDQAIYVDMMETEGFFERIKNNRIPNFAFAHLRYKMQDGSYRWCEQVVCAGQEFGIPEGMFRMYIMDINNIKTRLLGNIASDSSVVFVGRDQLTGLYSAKDFITKSDEKALSDKSKIWCVLSMDIEHFKMFDEWFGRDKGNYLLAKIGVLLKDFEEKYGAIAGYFGQDDFVVFLEHSQEHIEELYHNIRELISSFGFSAGFLPAIGVAIIDKDMTVVDALDRASIATVKAKSDIKNRIVTYNTEMQFIVDQEYLVLTDFYHALQEKEITFYLQPQCHSSSGQLVAAEALARWVKKDGTVIPPGKFVPILEKYGFITDLDKTIWDKAFAWVSKMCKAGKRIVPISLNVSRIDMFSIDIAEHFISLKEKYKINPKLIEIEITESAYMENMSGADKLVKALRDAGFKVVMDDFGSGYSSLNMLSTLKLDAIKLDAKFLEFNNENRERGIHILESVINMAKTMSLPMIVEGVETKEQIDFLENNGVRYIQGYYFYKPMPIKEFEKLISDPKMIDSRGIEVKTNEQFRIREFLDKNIYSDSMLNNIIGAVAIYSLRKNHVDIVRFNQQFMDSVDVPDFLDLLENIETTMPEEDRPFLFETLKQAKEDKLLGASRILRFYRQDGVLSSFKMHFYYIGKKEGTDRFYGSVLNVTDLVDLEEGKELMSRYSNGNMILVRHVGNQWKFTVVSHNLSDIIGVDPATLEKELNAGRENWRISEQAGMSEFINLIESTPPEKGKIFEKDITLINVKKEKVRTRIWIEYIGGESNNFAYILRSAKL